MELSGGVPGGGCGLGVDEVHHGLRLRQIQTAVQKGPAGEFSGPCLPGAGGEQGGEQLPQHHRGPVAVKLGGVLAGVAVGTGETDGEPPVNTAAPGVQHLSKNHHPSVLGGEGPAVGGAEHSVAQGKAPLAGHPDDADGGGGGPGGDGGDDIHET